MMVVQRLLRMFLIQVAFFIMNGVRGDQLTLSPEEVKKEFGDNSTINQEEFAKNFSLLEALNLVMRYGHPLDEITNIPPRVRCISMLRFIKDLSTLKRNPREEYVNSAFTGTSRAQLRVATWRTCVLTPMSSGHG